MAKIPYLTERTLCYSAAYWFQIEIDNLAISLEALSLFDGLPTLRIYYRLIQPNNVRSRSILINHHDAWGFSQQQLSPFID